MRDFDKFKKKKKYSSITLVEERLFVIYFNFFHRVRPYENTDDFRLGRRKSGSRDDLQKYIYIYRIYIYIYTKRTVEKYIRVLDAAATFLLAMDEKSPEEYIEYR